jgi:hypothetical protein
MRDDEPAEPTGWADLTRRIAILAHQIEQRAAANRQTRRLLHKLRFQLEQAASGDDDILWQPVAQTLDDLVQAGTQPSNLEVRDLVLPHIEIIPSLSDPPQGFELVLRETRRFQVSLQEEPSDDEFAQPEPIVVESAAELVSGRAVVLIGGDQRWEPKAALERSLRLSQLVWVPTKHGQPVSSFEPFIARPDVAVVLLAIRWASHAFTDVRHICRKYDKPLVRLPGGYSPNQVASQILNQCSWRLQKSRQRGS